MKKYKITIEYETVINAETEEEAYEEFFYRLERNNETAETFLSDNMATVEIEEPMFKTEEEIFNEYGG